MPVDFWRELVTTDDRRLQEWTCANPAKAKFARGRGYVHNQPWELDVQSYFRNDVRRRLRKAREKDGSLLWSGWVDGELACVAHIEVAPAYGASMIRACARASAFCGQGFGRELILECERLVREPDSRICSETIMARVHEKNQNSLNAFHSCGFEFVEREGDFYLLAKDLSRDSG